MRILDDLLAAVGLRKPAGHPRSPQPPGDEPLRRVPRRREDLHGVLTPARAELFERAMRQRATKAEFHALAEGFDRAGLALEAGLLRKRGDAREAPARIQEARRALIRRVMESGDPEKMEALAETAETKLGMTIAAGRLRETAAGLRVKRGLPPLAAVLPPQAPASSLPPAPPPGEEAARLAGMPACPLNVGGECIVHGVGGCIVEAKTYDPPPPAENVPDVSQTFDRDAHTGFY